MIDSELIEKLMRAVRTKSESAKEELDDLVASCIKDLEIAGVYVTNTNDALCQNAFKLYCKANYGYDADSEKFREAYCSLRDAMALSGDYGKPGE